MKINYYSEDFLGPLYSIIAFIVLMIIGVCYGIYNRFIFFIGGIIFISIWIIILAIPLLFSIKSYKKRKKQRNLNMYIIKNGLCIQGKVALIYDQYEWEKCFWREKGEKRYYNVTAEVNYTIYDEEMTIAVDHLCIHVKDMKKYENKLVNIYIYNNMSYVDIIN